MATPMLRQRAEAQDRLVRARLDQLVPQLMRRHGVDMWIVVAREYAEDPVLRTMLPATWMSARRRMVLVFHDAGPERGVERFAVARYPVGDFFAAAWDPETQPDQWARLGELVRARDPKKIAVNISDETGLADGLTVSQHRQLLAALGPLADRVVSHDTLAIGWLETRTPEDMAVYPAIMRAAHELLEEGLSERAIVPGVTTTADLVWWYREQLAARKMDGWCQPSVSIQRPAKGGPAIGNQTVPRVDTIEPGDLVHVDFCAGYLGLKTDTQQLAYVLRPGETAAPAGLVAGMAAANRLQDIVVRHYRAGITGNALLAAARKDALAAGLTPIIYSHPIGQHGHGAGPWIGRWENQAPLAGLGDYRINANTAWSIELAAMHKVPEWGGQEVRFALEVDGFFDGNSFRWIDGRQTRLHLIPRQPAP
ncbi:M24 family metallopeptidase [Sphingomonas changnyeongensis]|uniref:M24 family metallopeptidase n=1 Tax=Sphingomonas changnyeongensis TaxID=2698679 RepID=UPI001E304F80|nr:M24 family metallopeptidase [Sphingomonas changnyeongensis]